MRSDDSFQFLSCGAGCSNRIPTGNASVLYLKIRCNSGNNPVAAACAQVPASCPLFADDGSACANECQRDRDVRERVIAFFRSDRVPNEHLLTYLTSFTSREDELYFSSAAADM